MHRLLYLAGAAALLGALLWAYSDRQRLRPPPPIPTVETSALRQVARDQIDQAYARLDHKPGDLRAISDLALVLHAYDFGPAAEIAYRHVRLSAPVAGHWAYLHGIALRQLGRDDEAIAAWSVATRDAESSARAWSRLAELHLARADARQALRAANKGLSVQPTDPELRYWRGRALLETGDTLGALETLGGLLEDGVRHPGLHYAMARAARAVGRHALEQDQLLQFQRYGPGKAHWPDPLVVLVNDKVRTAKAVVNRIKRQLAQGMSNRNAIKVLENAARRDPEAYEAHIALVGLYGSIGEFEQVDRHYERAMALAPDTAQLHFNFGAARLEQRRYDAAREAFERAIELAPADARAYALLGSTRDRQGATDEALQLLSRAATLAPGEPIIWKIRAPILVRERRYAEALAALGTEAASPRDEAARQLLLGQVHRRTGDIESARAAVTIARDEALRLGDLALLNNVMREAKMLGL